ncbi:hypothetical protein CH249_12505 [Rhodococcus sp. 05-2255-3B1]|nr:hypothetical protein CH250_21135 [Rhodococcus sp. 05-2255-3C]OZE10598.1 hypothetical protein CH249_12505 [Rhodococcus sp. 05-2255-3B1]OZE20673.1 hypothetical protein CH255_08675 [Rhodococcus sp. 05-2255-2A2]
MTPAPEWAPALLGAVCAVVQGIEQLCKNNARSLEHHHVAQNLSGARRSLMIGLERGIGVHPHVMVPVQPHM